MPCLTAPKPALLAFLMVLGLAAPAAAETAPTRVAVFAFELDDFSGGAGIAGDAASDRRYLDEATTEARQQIGASSRYTLVDTGPAAGEEVRARTLYRCHGCDADIARALGADLSLVGVVTRISRTEFTLRIELRDTRTGDLVMLRSSGLRMGADYAWSRGARAVVRQALAEPQ
ncbi:DUF3280 domain-containing protein [Xanthobacter sp.]|uniref:DUF3280 domain-containing protein n=1 Tax=Xanthobacter sp. TaxID=35809 RepID=UPI0025CBF27F|nr:DUF3280 domain-containing protein [Xanthobacter sp.]